MIRNELYLRFCEAWYETLELITDAFRDCNFSWWESEEWDKQSYAIPVVVPAPTVKKRKKRNTVDDMVAAAVAVTDEAMTMAQELLEKWKQAELALCRYSVNKKEVEESICKKYEEYKNRLFKVRER